MSVDSDKSVQSQAATASRDLILKAADNRFAEHGFDSARLSDITADVGLTTGALYRSFPAKDDLPVALLDLLSTDLTESISNSPDQLSSLNALLNVLDQHPGALRLNFERSRWSGRNPFRDPRNVAVEALSSKLDANLAGPRLRVLSTLVVDMLFHHTQARHESAFPERDVDTIAAEANRLICEGIYAKGAIEPPVDMPPLDIARFKPSIHWQPSPEKTLPRSVKGIRTRQLIQDAAARVFTEQGLAVATINDVAQEAGIASGSVYRYFVDKADILRSMQAAVEESIIRESHLPLEHGRLAIRGQLLAYLDCYERNLGAIRAWRELAEPGSELADAWNGMRNSFIERTHRVLKFGKSHNIIQPQTNLEVVSEFHAMGYEAVAYSKLVLGYEPEIGVTKIADIMSKLFIEGFEQ